ncbi:MAG TPA: class I SAM-dependent methyltransferase [Solibacterales bacterium]|nr:class I SAM-dependent methyltransferase [Bryobacterales bacterium]
MKLYAELAEWWPLLSPPSHYGEEAADLLAVLAPDGSGAQTLLELGSGGGSLACHLKARLRLTLTDISPAMIAQNRRVNPECEFAVGDMRSLDLGRQFDFVLVHDAIMYAADPGSVKATVRTAARHCRPGGMVVLIPDFVRETFEPSTAHGGEDGEDGRALRYLEWTWDPDPSDCTYQVAYVYLMRDAAGHMSFDSEIHTEGLFERGEWLAWLREAGLEADSRVDPWGRDMFVGRRLAPNRPMPGGTIPGP